LIDAHHHLWQYTEAEYGWIGPTMEAIRRDFLPEDLLEAMAEVGVEGSVAVQARQSLEETRWLLQLAEMYPTILGVVGWAPIAAPDFVEVMGEFASQKKLCGLRHIVQGEPEGFLQGQAFNNGIDKLKRMDLVYDILIYERQLGDAITFVDRHPEQVFVLDHMAKPNIAEGEMEPWAIRIREMARRENVWCKVSGLVTEANWEGWTAQDLRPYLDVVVEAFGVKRLIAGSDWPVSLLASTYSCWWATLKEYFHELSSEERDAIFGETAKKVYGLTD
jgi:L-fuconolactonase